MNDDKRQLLQIIFEKSFCYDTEFGFCLASGKKSNVYIDMKKTVLSSAGMELVGKVVSESIKDLNIDGVGGLTLGADPIAYATALKSNEDNRPLEAFVVRKEPKKHGTHRWIEGNVTDGDRVVIIDDVATTGGSTIKAINRAREAGLKIVKVIALVDRQEGGEANIREACQCDFEAIFTLDQLLEIQKKNAGQ